MLPPGRLSYFRCFFMKCFKILSSLLATAAGRPPPSPTPAIITSRTAHQPRAPWRVQIPGSEARRGGEIGAWAAETLIAAYATFRPEPLYVVLSCTPVLYCPFRNRSWRISIASESRRDHPCVAGEWLRTLPQSLASESSVTGTQVKVITPELQSGTLAFSPHSVQGLSSPDGKRLNLHHHAAGTIDIEDLIFLSVVGIDQQPENPQVMLFIRDVKRPFLLRKQRYQLRRAAVPAQPDSTLERLRDLVRWLVQANPDLTIDRATLRFRQGRPGGASRPRHHGSRYDGRGYPARRRDHLRQQPK